MTGVEIFTGMRGRTVLTGARTFSSLFLTSRVAEICRRTTYVMNIALKIQAWLSYVPLQR